jgi:predicted dehydrogenase
MTPKTIAIIGAGSRGAGFAALIQRYGYLGKVVAVADPRDDYRTALAKTHDIAPQRIFKSWQDFCAQPKLCDAVVIATMDQEHVAPAVACLQKGYDLLLEKPMATSLADCRAIEAAQRKSGGIVAVCHSLRYLKGFRKVKELVAAGAIGRIVTLDLIEQVGFWHQAHSFVRGNWGNESRATFMLLAKSCHDLDFISYLIDRPCLRVSSFGALSYFRRENAPEGSAERCVAAMECGSHGAMRKTNDAPTTPPLQHSNTPSPTLHHSSTPPLQDVICPVEPTCAFSAIKQYVLANRTEWPASVCSLDHSYEAHLQAIRTGPYGRCVWKCDNDVVDHQVVNLQFADDITATFTMTAFSLACARRLRVNGTEGELHFDEKSIVIKSFADRNEQRIDIAPEFGSHGGGDERIVRTWLNALHTRDDRDLVANAQESLKTHTITFAAEKSRREKRTVELTEM